MKRSEMLAAMGERGAVWDVIIIGGGATGLSAAVEAASRGHRTLLVEADDFAGGTSSRSTKLIHGGVRYLRQGQIGMVRHSLRERERLLRNAPHIVHMLDFVLPTYRPGAREFYYAGLRFYDALAGHVLSGRTQRLSKTETCQRLPTLRDEGLRGGVLYPDGQFDDSRLAITLAQTAVKHGAVLANYMRVVRLVQTESRITGIVTVDVESGTEFTLQGRSVLNATGVFAENVLAMDSADAETGSETARPVVAPSQGSHLVLDAEFLPGSTALMIPETDDGRVLFAIPWHGKVLVGTTDIAVKEISPDPKPLPAEINYLLEHAGRYLRKQPETSDIRAHFSGLRPLVALKSGGKVTSQLSREHVIHISPRGLITVIGGKWTTCRQMGEELISRAENVGGLKRKKSITATLRLHGAPDVPQSRSSQSSSSQTDTQKKDVTSPAPPPYNVYGSDLSLINDLVQSHPEFARPLHARLSARAAEVIWAARHEMARTVEDVLARRTRALFLDAAAAIESAPLVAEVLAQELGRSPDWQQAQIQSFRVLARTTFKGN